MATHGTLAWVIAAVLRELVGPVAMPEAAGVLGAEPNRIGKGRRYGGLGTPILRNYIVTAFSRPPLWSSTRPPQQ